MHRAYLQPISWSQPMQLSPAGATSVASLRANAIYKPSLGFVLQLKPTVLNVGGTLDRPM